MRLDFEQMRYTAEDFIRDAGDEVTGKELREKLRRLDGTQLQEKVVEFDKDAALMGSIATGGFAIYSMGKGMEFVAKRMTGKVGVLMHVGSKILEAAGIAGLTLGTGGMAEVYRNRLLIASEASERYLEEKK